MNAQVQPSRTATVVSITVLVWSSSLVALGAPPPTLCDGVDATVVGTRRADELTGTDGRDVIVGLGGDDTISALDGNDLVCAGEGFDLVFAGRGSDRVLGGPGDDNVLGEGGEDALFGQGDVDSLAGGRGDDRLVAGPGEAITTEGLDGGPGDDRLDGGPGLDTALFFDAPGGVSVSLLEGAAIGHGRDRLVGVEGVVGSNFDDFIEGDDSSNGLFGNAGDDRIFGRGSGSFRSSEEDVLAGDDGDDLLVGGAGADVTSYAGIPVPVTVDLAAGTASGQGSDELHGIEGIWGSEDDDVLRGDDARNQIVGGLGNDELRGRQGVDIAVFADVRGPVTVDLASGDATGAGNDTLAGIEAVWGTSGDDTILGDGADNVIEGRGGADELAGRAGDDVLDGGDGADQADGGAGEDVCLSVTKTTGCEGP